MVSSSLAAPLHFTIEFVGFVVAAGAVFLIPFRPNLVPGGRAARAAATLGFASLAAAGVVHGALFVAADSSDALVALRAFGLCAVLVAVAAKRIDVPVAAAALTLDRPALFVPAAAGLLLAIVALLRSQHTGLGHLRRLALAGLLFAVAEGLVAATPAAGAVGDVSDVVAWQVHGLRLAAWLLVASWLWAGVGASVRSRFVAAFAALLVLVVLALSTTLSAVITTNVEREELDRVATQLDGGLRSIEDQERSVSRFVRLIAGANAVRNAVSSGRRLRTIADKFVNSDAFPLDFIVFTTPEGRLITRSGSGPAVRRGGEASPTDLERAHVVALLGSPVLTDSVIGLEREIAVRVDPIGSDAVGIVAAAELLDPSNAGGRAGIVVAGRWLDAFTVEELTRGLEPAEATLLLGDRVIASDLSADAAAAIDVPPDVRSDLTPGGHGTTAEQTISGHSYFSAFGVIESEAGEPTLVLSSPAEIISDTRRDIIRSLFLVTLAIGAVALALAWLSGRRITKPIQLLTRAAGSVREGNLDAVAPVGGRDEVGELGGAFNAMTSALRRTTDELRQAAREEEALRARIETIIQSMADGLIAVDAERRILAFNIEAELLTGIKAEDAIGRAVREVLIVHDGRGDRVELPVYELGEGAVANVYVERRYGTPVPVAITSAVLRDERYQVAGAVAVMRDMSREHEIEKLKGEFLSNISHELRTPLTPIKGYSELLTRRDLPQEKTERFAIGIRESTQRLERIVSLLVDYAAIEAGRLAPRTSTIEMSALLKSLAEEWSDRSARHNLESRAIEDLPKVAGDERLLRRSIEEILDNAIKFSPDGGTITLEARVAPASNGKGMLEVSVSDEGIGIPPDDLPHIFSDFHQVDASETRSFGGLGLGLALVHRIVSAHQGEVRVESRPEMGTRLTIAVPVAKAPSGATS